MYIWPEVSPGSLLDGYKEIRPSDWRFIASIPEAVRNAWTGLLRPSKLRSIPPPSGRGRGCDRTSGREGFGGYGGGHREWQSSETDFRALALLAPLSCAQTDCRRQLTISTKPAILRDFERARKEDSRCHRRLGEIGDVTTGFFPRTWPFGQRRWPLEAEAALCPYDLKMLSERERIYRQFAVSISDLISEARCRSRAATPTAIDRYVVKSHRGSRVSAGDPRPRTVRNWVRMGQRGET